METGKGPNGNSEEHQSSVCDGKSKAQEMSMNDVVVPLVPQNEITWSVVCSEC